MTPYPTQKEKIYEILNRMYADKSYIDCAYEDLLILRQADIKSHVEKLKEMKKKTHKIVEAKFWYDEDKWPEGEFEQYGEYEMFFIFAKKMRRQALSAAISYFESLLTNH